MWGIMMRHAYLGIAFVAIWMGQCHALEKDAGPRVLHSDGQVLAISQACPQFVFETETAGNPLEVIPRWEASIEGGVQVYRQWARFRLAKTASPRLLKEVVLQNIDLQGKNMRTFPGDAQSYPVFVDGFFMGVEFPVAATRVENGHVLVAHRPGLWLEPNTWYETRKAVFGLAPVGEEMQAFHRYILAHRPPPKGLHVNYNSWWTSPAPYYTEADILGLMETFRAKLFDPYGVSFDTFCIDMGWSDLHSLWQIDKKLFPQGFANLQRAARRMDSHLGLWISPSSCYPTALDNAWAHENGYETFKTNNVEMACLGGKRYATAFRDCLTDRVKHAGVRHLKLDGYVLECPESDHGHAPGALSHEAVAEGIIAAGEAAHKAAKKTWLEPTCFGWNPSPWWLFYFNSVIGSYGDDAPNGRVPAPVYRESYTTARDYFNLQGAYWSPVPQAAQEVLGVIHQTEEPFLNDAVMTLMRGHMFLPIYLNPKYMDEDRWKLLAGFLKWARAIAPKLEHTAPLLPKSWRDGACPKFSDKDVMPREPYGYAHWSGAEGYVALRNPWIVAQSYTLTLDKGIGVPTTLAGVNACSVYPEARQYGRDLKYGDTIEVPLAPYETIVLHFSPSTDTMPLAVEAIRHHVSAQVTKREITRIEYEGPKEAFGPDWTSLIGEGMSDTHLVLEAETTVAAPEEELLVLLDGTRQRDAGRVQLHINGQEVVPTPSSSETGWSASGLERPEHWLFLRAPLPAGTSQIVIDLFASDADAKASAWVWAGKPGTASSEGLSQPERISLDSVALIEPTVLATAAIDTARMQRPVEKIDGIFLDAIEPVSVTQGFGVLQKNQSVWEKPMTIAGKAYRRGLGTHSPSKIVYALEDRFRRFQAWAGADGAVTPSITFEVWVDGQRRWESGLMHRDDAAKQVDVDVTGAKTLELVVGDGGNDIMADHADWAEAKLLR